MIYTCKRCGWIGEVKSRPRCLRCSAERKRKWRIANPEKHKADKAKYIKRFRETRREEFNAKRRKYYLPKTAARRWSARKRWLEAGTVTSDELREIYKAWKGLCAYCKCKVSSPRYNPTDPRGFDHVVPRTRGGKHEASNLVVCCRRCNELKAG